MDYKQATACTGGPSHSRSKNLKH